MSTTNLSARRRRLYAALLVMPDIQVCAVGDLHDVDPDRCHRWIIYVCTAPDIGLVQRLHATSAVTAMPEHVHMPFGQLLLYILERLDDEAIDSIEDALEAMGRYTP